MHFRLFAFWRLFAAMLVMVYHFLWHAPAEHFFAVTVLYRLLPLLDMFFMISGFLIMLRYSDRLSRWDEYRDFLVKRLARLYPLYLVTLSFFVLVTAVVSMGWMTTSVPERYDFSVLWQNILLLQAWGTTDHLTFNYVSWSLSAEWFCYLTLPLLVLVARRAGAIGLIGLAMLVIAALEYATAADIIPIESWFSADTWGAYRAFIDFALGGAVAIFARDTTWRLRSHWPAWCLFVGSIAAMLMMWNTYAVFVLMLAALATAAVAERNNPEASRFLAPLDPVARASFSIYLIHPIVEALLLSGVWYRIVSPMDVLSFYVFWLLPIAGTIMIAVASDRLFETPVNRFIVSRLSRRKPALAIPKAQSGVPAA